MMQAHSSNSVEKLQRFMGRTVRIKITDGRIIEGELLVFLVLVFLKGNNFDISREVH